MSELTLTTDTYNLFPAAPASHIMRFERMPFLSFTIQEVNLPEISATPAQVQSPGFAVKFAPDRLQYGPLQVTFMIDEEFRVHQELHAWLAGVTGREDRSVITARFMEDQGDVVWQGGANKPRTYESTAKTVAGLTIVNEAKIPLLRVLFFNVYPTSVGSVQFSVTADPKTVMTSTASFDYDFYTIVKIE
jgi:chorismate mutase